MDQQPQPNIPFGLLYKVLTCFDRRELCHLRNVNHRHYTVIENKFGTTAPYLVFGKLFMSNGYNSWSWSPTWEKQTEEMPFCHLKIVDSKFVRFKFSSAYVSGHSNYTVRDISHVWENQHVSMSCSSTYVWDEKYSRIAATAKILDMSGRDVIPYLRQLTSGNCIRLSLTDRNNDLVVTELPWDHILDFLFKPNAKSIEIHAENIFKCQQELVLDFLQHAKQKFLDTVAPIDFKFQFRSYTDDNGFIYEGFLVKNQQTKQSLRFHSTAKNFELIVEKDDQ
ncbi:hypothetical protein DdX_09559 [Ditylenchus destructor]|uniref:F-box domain-containing protein n=1 Tax=Ditylenchus destructor TaxID=166010 RepID=A0AAD4N3G8_9BILA|nr:hypothetical protein DdX_09559 [Ditylenchus destructor]